jgi:hypothetical protein
MGSMLSEPVTQNFLFVLVAIDGCGIVVSMVCVIGQSASPCALRAKGRLLLSKFPTRARRKLLN